MARQFYHSPVTAQRPMLASPQLTDLLALILAAQCLKSPEYQRAR